MSESTPENLVNPSISLFMPSYNHAALIDGKVEAFVINSGNLGLNQRETNELLTKAKWDSVDFLLNAGQRFDAIK